MCPLRYLRLSCVLLLVIATLVIGGSLIRAPDSAHVATPIWTPVSEQRLSHGRFKNLVVYTPHGIARAFVLLLSGEDGWNQAMGDLATHIAQQGAVVTGIDVAQFNAALEADGAQCEFPDGDFENLSHFVQAYLRLPTYVTPIVAGYSAGATLAYATLIQAPKNTFAGAVSLEFCPSYGLNKPLCKGSGIEFTPSASGRGVDFLPSTQPGNPLDRSTERTRVGLRHRARARFCRTSPGRPVRRRPRHGGALGRLGTPIYVRL